ncbi:uncharacterized protein LOC129948242 [Eupeodes corollae]|uniref:uncharacterized protein LOC129948242 n=1 Tax=Eupeodes corollae TaxID=290404 RepID=UPI0024936D55|nr:uncharacterized protein LOC129948242 [Eupeodes corollae]
MEDLSDFTSGITEFLPYSQGKEQTTYRDTSTGTDPLPPLLDKAIETNKKSDAQTQTQKDTIPKVDFDVQKLAQWLKRIYPLVESELQKGPTPLSSEQILNTNENEDELEIQPYQKISIKSKDNHQGLSTWLSIYTNNTPVLVLTTCAVHDDWCEHVEQSIKVYIPKRISPSQFVVFQELKTIPTKACIETLSTNPFYKDIFAGSTVSGDLYIWKFVTNKHQGDVEEIFCENLQHGSVAGLDWPSAGRVLTCHANGWVCLWSIENQFLKEREFLVKNPTHGVVELTSIASISLTDFVVGCADGALYHCNNTNLRAYQTDIEIVPMKNHKFSVTSLFKKEICGKRLVISCDLSGEVFFHDLFSSDDDDRKTILRIPLPFQNNIACSSDGKHIFCPGIDGSLNVYRIYNGRQLNIKGALHGKGNMIKLSDNGLWIVIGIFDGDFQIFRIAN